MMGYDVTRCMQHFNIFLDLYVSLKKTSLSDIVGLATTLVKICSTSNNSKLFATEEKTNNLVLEIKRAGI